MDASHSEIRDADQIAQDFSAMNDCIWVISAIIAGDTMVDEEDSEKLDCVDRNVRHLEIMVAKDDWGNESMTASNNAVTAGKAYIG